MTYRIMNQNNEILSTYFEANAGNGEWVEAEGAIEDWGPEYVEWWAAKDGFFTNSYETIDEAKEHAKKLKLENIKIVKETVSYEVVA